MPLAERHLWLVQLMDWVRAGEPVSGVKYIVRQLAPPSERRTRVVALLSAFWRDIDVAALLADYGFAARTSFIDELGERLRTRMLPMSPDVLVRVDTAGGLITVRLLPGMDDLP